MAKNFETALARWSALLAGARHRASTLPADADGRLTALITKGQHRGERFADELARLDREVTELEDELDSGWREISSAFDRAMAEADAQGAADDVRRLRWQRAGERKKAEEIRQRLITDARKVDVEARADAARALHSEAAQVWDRAHTCSGCGATWPVGAVYETTDFRCTSCGAKERVEPDPAALEYLQEARVGALAEEAVLAELGALDEARRAYTGWLHPIEDDFVAFEDAVRKTWTRWADTLAPLHPAWDSARARREAAHRIDGTLAPWRSDAARDRRQLVTRGYKLLQDGKQREALDLAHTIAPDASRLIEDLCVSLHEHNDRTTAWHGLALLHHVGRISDQRDDWMRRRIGELDEALRTR